MKQLGEVDERKTENNNTHELNINPKKMGEIKIHDKFRPLWESTANYFIITGGRASGKSFAVGDFIENLTFEKGIQSYLHVIHYIG